MTIQRINLGTAPSGTGGDTNRSAFSKIDANFADSANAASRLVTTSATDTTAGSVLKVGDFGLSYASGQISGAANLDTKPKNGFYRLEAASGHAFNNHVLISCANYTNGGFGWQMGIDVNGTNAATLKIRKQALDGVWSTAALIYNEHNTTVDANGFIKKASPIVQLYADKIELNDEANLQQITFVKNGIGDYLVKGSTGFAQDGWYIEMPKDANGNVLVAVIYEQLANNDISVKTYAKMFDPDTGDIVANTSRPRDIPLNRWIDLRLQELPRDESIMPYSAAETVATAETTDTINA